MLHAGIHTLNGTGSQDYISSFDWDELRDTNKIGDASVSSNWAITAGLKIGF